MATVPRVLLSASVAFLILCFCFCAVHAVPVDFGVGPKYCTGAISISDGDGFWVAVTAET